MTGRKVVVIGSGPGGSALAALMANAGHHVLLVEKNSFPGGRCSSLARGGFVVDTGVHMFGRGPSGPFGEITRILEDGPRWYSLTPSFTLKLAAGGTLEMASSIAHPASVASFIRGRCRGRLRMRWASTARRSMKVLGLTGLASLAGRFADRRFPLYSGLQGVSVRDFLSPLSGSDDLLRAFHAQAMLTMALPWQRADMGEFAYILATMMLASGLCYPRGGSGAIAASFLRAMERSGGEVRWGCEVASIDVEGGRVRGVTTAGGESIPADIVASSAGLHRTIEMAGRGSFPSGYLRRADGLRDSEAFIAVKLLLERKLSSMRTPCLLRMPALPPHAMFDYLEDGSVPDDLFLFVTAPGIWDPCLVPPGGDCLIVGVPAPSRLDRAGQARSLLDRAEELALEIFPEIAGATVGRERVYCADVSSLSGRQAGDCIGIAQEVGQSGSLRPRSSTPVEGLFLVGADAGGRGIGTEMAADSALRLYHLLKDGLSA